MAQFDVYKNENDQTNQRVPYLLDIQNDILDSINTKIVIPLVKDKNDFKGLIKEFIIENQKVYLTTSQMGTIHKNELKTKITTLQNQKEEIKNSIDFLIYGF